MHNDILKILDTYNYSINIYRDYSNLEKVNYYIPTYRTLNLLHKYLNEIINQGKKSFLLSGAYGTGKSYLISIILYLLHEKLDEEKIHDFVEKSKKHYGETDSILSLVRNKKYVLVFPEDNFSNFKQSIMLGILKSADKYGIKFNIPTVFKMIKTKIDNWDENYGDIYENLVLQLKSKGISVSDFRKGIESYNNKFLEIFEEIYSKLFAGEKFIPLGSISKFDDILYEYEKAVMSQTDYNGIVYVFDEFGRYLETNIENIDVKEVQDMAEYCNIQEYNSTLFLITHKDVFQYTSKISKENIRNEWEKVSGRFNREHLVYEKQNIIKIIETILSKTEKYYTYVKENKHIFDNYINNLRNNPNPNANGLGAEPDKLLEKYYPLNYMGLKVLPGLSQKIAQNERTLFSFLCGDENNSMRNIKFENESENLYLVSFPEIYDYFERNFAFLENDSIEYKVYANTKSILKKVDKKIEIRYIKTLALIYIFNDFNEAKPTKETMMFALNIEVGLFDKVTAELMEKDFIVYREHSNHYKIRDEININIDKEIEKEVNNLKKFDLIETLEETLPLSIYYPIEYNINNRITRYLKQYYLDVSNLQKMEKISKEKNCDGKIIFLLNFDKKNFNVKQLVSLYKEVGIFVYRKSESINIENEILQIEAINNIIRSKSNLIGNETIKQEILSYKYELLETINKKLKTLNEFKECSFFVGGEEIKEIDFNELITQYLSKKYFKYKKKLQIGYELINRNILTPQIRKIRVDLLKKIEKSDFYNYKFKHTAAENSVARNLLENTKIFNNEGIDIKSSYFSEIYDEIIKKIKEKTKLDVLYKEYCSIDSEYGFRKGVFSFILMLIIFEHKSDIVIVDENGNEKSIDPEDINVLEEKPQKYEITFIKYDAKKRKFLNEILRELKLYVEDNQSISKSASALLAFKNFLLSLPKIILTGEHKSLAIRKILKGILTQNNSMEFWFVKLPKIYGVSTTENILNKFISDIKFLKDEKEKLRQDIKENIIRIFSLKGSLRELNDWKKDEKNKNFELFDFINNIEDNIIYDDRLLILKLTEKVMGFNYYNWREVKDFDDFYLKVGKKIIDEESYGDLSKKIVINDGEAESLVRISKEKESSIGKILKSKIISDLKNIGGSVSEDEKKRILFEILINK